MSLPTLAAVAAVAPAAWAQSVLEDIVVTARKTAETLDDVPISVSVTQGEKLENMSIDGLEDLSEFVPNLQINENATQQTVTIRGVGSGANQAFEQSVGIYIDGVYFGRGRSARNPFFDVERVEILKGPQGILFGKNTIAGAVNITTKKPTDNFTGYALAEYFTDIEQVGVSGAVSGPLTNRLSARLAAGYRSEGGYVDNSFTGKEEERRDEYIVRGTLLFNATDNLELILKGELSAYNVDGRVTQNVQAGPLEALYRSLDPEFESQLDFRKSTPGDDFDNTDTQNLVLTANYDIGDAVTLTSVTAYVAYDFKNNIPAEFAPLEYAEQANRQDYEQFSQELRVHYRASGPLEFIGGLYYANEDLSIEETFNFNLSNLIALGVPIFPLDSSIVTFFDQETDSYAVFGELRYDITDRLTGSVGLRYTNDAKDVDKTLVVAALGTQTPAPSQEPLAAIIGRIPHSYRLSRRDTDFSPAVGLQYHLTDDAMLYATYSQGFKSGGFDAQNTTGDLALAEFQPEDVEAFEFGGKFTFAGGAAKLNIAYFNNDFSNLQVSAFNGLTFATTNAASATSQGVEMDAQWRPLDALTLGMALAWLDAEYDAFPDATCTAPQQTAFAAATGLPAGQCTQDLGGRDLQFSPDFAGNVNAIYEIPLAGRFLLTAQADVNFTTGYFTAQDLDPISKQSGFAKLNMRVAFGDLDSRWSLAVIGRNLTNRKTTTWVNDVPIFRGAYFGFVDPPRSFGAQLRVNW